MNNHIRVHVVEPGSSIIVPNTGGVFHGESQSGEALPLITAGIIALLIMGAIIVMIIANKKKRKSFGYSKGLKMASSRGRLLALFALIAIVGLIPFVASEIEAQSEKEVSALGDGGDALSIVVDDVDLDVEVEDEKVFAFTSSGVRVSTPTRFGYDLMVYADSNELVSAEGNKITSMDEDEGILTDNTWGVSLRRPEDQENGDWMAMPTTIDEAIEARSVSTATDETSTTRIYYGVYVTPDLPYGDYVGPTINYVAVAKVVEPEVTMVFSSGDAYFDEARTQKTNTVGFARTCSSETVYVNEEYQTAKTGSYDDKGEVTEEEYTFTNENKTIHIPGADRLLVLLEYGISDDDGGILIFNTANEAEFGEETIVDGMNGFGDKTVEVEGDTVTIATMTYEKLEELMNREKSNSSKAARPSVGYYARVYAFYDTPNADTTEVDFPGECSCKIVSGELKMPILEEGQTVTEWNTDGYTIFDNGEEDLLNTMEDWLFDALYGRVVLFEPEIEGVMTITYDANGGEFASYCLVQSTGGTRALGPTNDYGCTELHETSMTLEYYIGEQSRYGLSMHYFNYVNGTLGMIGWSENPRGEGTIINDGDYFVPADDEVGTHKTLYAVWVNK